ncbi:MAG: hypothetical protein HUJ52_03625, partial [Malacoplasma sp.]|nr:hypothetical protein [Malacoplasma sp.]
KDPHSVSFFLFSYPNNNDITIDSKNFLNTVNKYCFTIHAGLYLNKYKATEPWTEFANNIVE